MGDEGARYVVDEDARHVVDEGARHDCLMRVLDVNAR